MNPFKRLIVSLSGLLSWIAMVVGALAGGLLGRAAAQFVSTSPFLSQRTPVFSVMGMPDIEFGGLLAGVLLGFLIPAVAASLLFLMSEIRRQSQETAEGVAALQRASATKRVEPPAPAPRRIENGSMPRSLRPSGPPRPAWRSRPHPVGMSPDPAPERSAEEPQTAETPPTETQQPQQAST